jgi:PTS system nitrogen regulatory IIA component
MFASVVDALNLPDPSDKQMVVELMLAREATGSTAVGKGIAIPHVRAPLVVHGASSLLQLCYLASPVDLGAKDGPVNTLFLMITPTPKAHLQLLSRLSAALHDSSFRNVVLARSPLEDVLREARRVEASFPSTDR